MVEKLFNWIFRQTKIGKLLDGHTRELGFIIWLLGYLIEGLGHAATVFPDTPMIGAMKESLMAMSQQLGNVLKTIGMGSMAVGVANSGVKDRAERAKGAVLDR